MALQSTIYKAELAVSDLDRGHYGSHSLTLARHPSETEERMMIRLLAFALYADDALAFGRGVSTDDEPDLWLEDATGAVELWIEVGLPDEREIRKACGRARRVVVLAFGGRKASQWWEQNGAQLARNDNLRVLMVPADAGTAVGRLAARSMVFTATIQDGHVFLAGEADQIEIAPQTLKDFVEQRSAWEG